MDRRLLIRTPAKSLNEFETDRSVLGVIIWVGKLQLEKFIEGWIPKDNAISA